MQPWETTHQGKMGKPYHPADLMKASLWTGSAGVEDIRPSRRTDGQAWLKEV